MLQYKNLLRKIIVKGESHDDRTGVGTLSLFGEQMRFDLTGEQFPLLTVKKIPFRWVAEELFWFLRGSTNEHELEDVKVDIWKEWATPEQCNRFGREPGDLGPVYGFLWRNFGGPYYTTSKRIPGNGGVDQIFRLMHDLEYTPNSRRHLVTGWDPESCDRVAIPPCHTVWQIKVHPDKSLSCHLYARSIDAFLGLPFNIASYALLTHLIAAAAGFRTRELIISFGDVHLYKNHINQAKEALRREPRPSPILRIVVPIGYTPLERLLAVEWRNLILLGYNPHGKIEAEVAI